jgi:hypothetical protein
MTIVEERLGDPLHPWLVYDDGCVIAAFASQEYAELFLRARMTDEIEIEEKCRDGQHIFIGGDQCECGEVTDPGDGSVVVAHCMGAVHIFCRDSSRCKCGETWRRVGVLS